MTERQTGLAAMLGGGFFFVGQGGELVFDSPEGLWVAIGIAGFVALAAALWGLRKLVGATRAGRVGSRLALFGAALLLVFAVQLAVEVVRTGEVPDNFILFAAGFLLILLGQLLFARDLRAVVGRAWVLPIVGVGGLALALLLNTAGLHDIGLFVFEGAWVGLGLALIRGAPPEPEPVGRDAA